jgi:S1-C subfamily serine protease
MANFVQDLSTVFTSAAETAGHFTVLVNARHRHGASGIVYKSDLVVTANHVVEHEDEIQVVLPEGGAVTASLAGRDPARDLAVLRVSQGGLFPATLSPLQAQIGLPVLAIARPDADGIQASFGIVTAIGGPVRTHHGALLESYLRTETNPYPGFSGGPLVGLDGALVGLNTSGLSMGSLLTIPASIVWQAAESIALHGHIRRGFLGVRSQSTPLSEANQSALGRKQDSGLLMVGVEDNSPSATGGLLVGDILVGVAGTIVGQHEELQEMLDGDQVGKKVELEILRGGMRQVLMVEIGERA